MQDAVLDACSLINLLASGEILVVGRRESRAERKSHGRPPRAIKLDPPVPADKAEETRSSASDRVTQTGLDLTLHVPSQVAAEALYVLHPDENDASKLVKNPIDLAPLVDAGLIHHCEPEGAEELELFVRLATSLDDGEAACLALASTRGWTLATDDRPAARFASQLGVPILTTPDLVRRWADFTQASDDEVASVLNNIQRFARFTPRVDSMGYSWWIKNLSK